MNIDFQSWIGAAFEMSAQDEVISLQDDIDFYHDLSTQIEHMIDPANNDEYGTQQERAEILFYTLRGIASAIHCKNITLQFG